MTTMTGLWQKGRNGDDLMSDFEDLVVIMTMSVLYRSFTKATRYGAILLKTWLGLMTELIFLS